MVWPELHSLVGVTNLLPHQRINTLSSLGNLSLVKTKGKRFSQTMTTTTIVTTNLRRCLSPSNKSPKVFTLLAYRKLPLLDRLFYLSSVHLPSLIKIFDLKLLPPGIPNPINQTNSKSVLD
uniref:Uncharacterized protein n=1 Tax=Cryptococcus bacillisporus CA1280 TaxID=1296109 RepID=A0A0D0VE80_CRYGA|nr:hypothetical protein I312_04796 [Cryptococcus bacillisporus CA1280]